MRKVFKTENMKNLILQDANAEEIVFPELEVDDHPSKGDKIEIDGRTKETGERLMPDGSLIKFKEGAVTKIVQPSTEEIAALSHTRKINNGVCRTFKSWKNNRSQKIEILGSNFNTPFRKGNRIMVDGKKMLFDTIQINNKEIKIRNGRIDAIKSIKGTGATSADSSKKRRVFKPTGKKMIGKPFIPKSTSEKKEPTKTKKQTSGTGNEKFVWMKK